MKLLKRDELNQQLKLKTTQSSLLKIEQLRILFDALDTKPGALDVFLKLMEERHKKAENNSRLALEINQKNSLITKMKNLGDVEKSEILNFGKSIWSALQKRGEERFSELRSHDLVHKDDHNQVVTGLKEVIEEQNEVGIKQDLISSTTIHGLEKINDELRRQNQCFKKFAIDKYGVNSWKRIEAYVLKTTQKDA